MNGFQNPTRRPRNELITAAEPASCGATKLVPPQPVSSGLPVNPVKYSSYPVNGSASADRSGTARPVEVPVITVGVKSNVHADGRLSPVVVVNVVGVRYSTALYLPGFSHLVW